MAIPGVFFPSRAVFDGGTSYTSTTFVYGTPTNETAGDGYDSSQCNWLGIMAKMVVGAGITAQLKVEFSTAIPSGGNWFPVCFRDYYNTLGTAVALDSDSIGADVPSYPRYELFPAGATTLRSYLIPVIANFYRIGVKVAGVGSVTPTVTVQRLVL